MAYTNGITETSMRVNGPEDLKMAKELIISQIKIIILGSISMEFLMDKDSTNGNLEPLTLEVSAKE